MIDNRVETMFQDVQSLYHEAMEELSRGKIRDAAGKPGGNAKSNQRINIS